MTSWTGLRFCGLRIVLAIADGFENRNTDAFKHEIPISGYVEAILGKKQILQDKKKKPKPPFHTYPAKYVKKK